MSEYQLLQNTESVLRVEDQACIPNDPANRDRAIYNQWLAAGGVPDPMPPKIDPELDSVGTTDVKTAAQILGAT